MAKKQLLKIEGVYFAYTNIDKPRKDTFDTSGLTKKFNATVFLNKEQRKFFKEQKLKKLILKILKLNMNLLHHIQIKMNSILFKLVKKLLIKMVI